MLYTLDYNEEHAEQGAALFTAKDTAELDTIADYQFDKHVEWTEADFGDCWVKLHVKPEIDADGNTTFYDHQNRAGRYESPHILCSVRSPGQHPGGKSWWLTPVDPVMVPIAN